MEFFRHEIITNKVIRIIDVMDNCFYLVCGETRACLLDTGDGFGDLKSYVETLTDLPVFVALTHGHLDHVGGCYFYDEIYLNRKDYELFESHNSSDFRLNLYRESTMKDVPISELNPEYKGNLQEIKDGDCFDLGGTTVKFVEVAGHTLGMMVPIILEERIAIFGDACGVGTLLFSEGSTSISEYRENLLNFKQNESLYDTVLRNHGTFVSPKELLDNVIECCDDILSGNYEKTPIETHGQQFLVAKPIDSNGNRVDGKQGNIKFTQENLR